MTNPLFVFSSVWFLVLFLYSLGLTTNLVSPPVIGLLVIIINLFGMLVLYLLMCAGRRSKEISLFRESKLLGYFKFIVFVWLLGSSFEVYWSGGLPLLWRLVDSERLYTEFGVPSFHGVMNAFYLHIVTVSFYLYVRSRGRGFLFFAVILLCWPVLMLGRGILLSAIIQMACVYFYFNRLSPSRLFFLLVLVVSVVFIFGVIGDMRQEVNPFSYLVDQRYDWVFDNLPSGFLWFYVYLTAGLSNFFANIESLSTNFQFGGYAFSNLIPTFLRELLRLDPRNDVVEFVDANLNTSTIYAGFISDFGALGGIFLVTVVQFFCCLSYSLLVKGNHWGVFAYPVCFQVLVFSIFYDMFFLLPTIFQLVICFVLYVYLKSPFLLFNRKGLKVV